MYILGVIVVGLANLVWGARNVGSFRLEGLPCAFALSFTCDEFLSDVGNVVDQFLLAAADREGRFVELGVDFDTGMTFDGHGINYTTGEPLLNGQHPFSAPSKEAFHVALLGLALEQGAQEKQPPIAWTWATGGWYKNDSALLEVVRRKLASYDSFDKRYPGFGGYLPWYSLNSSGMGLLPGWENRVPSLDNGEWFWGLVALENGLRSRGETSLADQVRRKWMQLASNAQTIFASSAAINGTVWAVVSINDVTKPVSSNVYTPDGGVLNDPYEGELFTWIVDLWGTFPNASARELLWEAKRKNLVAINYTTPANTITVQRGFWYSSHEVFKILYMPYRNDSLAYEIFRNGEIARTQFSANSNTPGMHASCADVAAPNSTNVPDYASASGIPILATQSVTREDIVTPYSSYSAFLFNTSIAACWYRNMLAGPRMQGPYGSCTTVAVNGTEIAPSTTWDSKISTILAAAGGSGNLVIPTLQNTADPFNTSQTAWDRFLQVVHREHLLAFGPQPLPGHDASWATPTTTIPRNILGSFTECT